MSAWVADPASVGDTTSSGQLLRMLQGHSLLLPVLLLLRHRLYRREIIFSR